MATQYYWIGSNGPFEYDDTDVYPDATSSTSPMPLTAITLEGARFLQVYLDNAASQDTHALRYQEASAAGIFDTPEDYGAVGDGVTDDTVAVQAAIDAADGTSGIGGIVRGRRGSKYRIAGHLYIRDHTHFVGHEVFPGAPYDYARWSTITSALVLGSSYTIYIGHNSSLSGWLIYRRSMTLPMDLAGGETPATTYGGTAITIAGKDAMLQNLMILGFEYAIYSDPVSPTQYERVRCDRVFFDCLNGIHISEAYDVCWITDCHGWCFVTQGSTGATQADHIRGGYAFYIHEEVAWCKLSGCFSFGYYRGLRINDNNWVIATDCGFDNPVDGSGVPLHTNSVGILVLTTSATSTGVKIDNCQCASNDEGIRVDVAAGDFVEIANTTLWNNVECGVRVVGGDVSITGGMIKDSPYGVKVLDAASRVTIDNIRFEGIATNPVYVDPASTLVLIGHNDYGDLADGSTAVAGTLTPPVLTPATAVVALPVSGHNFNVAAGDFGALTSGWQGRVIELKFNGASVVYNGTGAAYNMYLCDGRDLVTVAGTTLTLMHNGTQWYEISRSHKSILNSFANVRVATATFDVYITDELVVCNSSSAMTANFLVAATGTGKSYYFKSIGTGVVTLDPYSTDTIDGETTQTLNQWDGIRVVDYGSGTWAVV